MLNKCFHAQRFWAWIIVISILTIIIMIMICSIIEQSYCMGLEGSIRGFLDLLWWPILCGRWGCWGRRPPTWTRSSRRSPPSRSPGCPGRRCSPHWTLERWGGQGLRLRIITHESRFKYKYSLHVQFQPDVVLVSYLQQNCRIFLISMSMEWSSVKAYNPKCWSQSNILWARIEITPSNDILPKLEDRETFNVWRRWCRASPSRDIYQPELFWPQSQQSMCITVNLPNNPTSILTDKSISRSAFIR